MKIKCLLIFFLGLGFCILCGIYGDHEIHDETKQGKRKRRLMNIEDHDGDTHVNIKSHISFIAAIDAIAD